MSLCEEHILRMQITSPFFFCSLHIDDNSIVLKTYTLKHVLKNERVNECPKRIKSFQFLVENGVVSTKP